MCMFHKLPFWLSLLTLLLITGLIFAIPLSDWIKKKRSNVHFGRKRIIRYDGMVATDLHVINQGVQPVTLQEVGVYSGEIKNPVEKDLSLQILPGKTLSLSYLNASDAWYIILKNEKGDLREIKTT